MSPQKKRRAVSRWYLWLGVDLDAEVCREEVAEYLEARGVALLQRSKLALLELVLRGISLEVDLREDGLAAATGQISEEDARRVPRLLRAEYLNVERM